jgi:hypothetical protein
MVQHVYALFHRSEDAVAALDEMRAAGCESGTCSAVLHENRLDKGALTITERGGMALGGKGAAVAGMVGAVVAGLAALGGGLVGVGPLAAAVIAGAVMAGYGMLAGSISGSDDPEPVLRAIRAEVEQKGKLLIAVETEDSRLREVAEEVFERHGGYKIVS